MARPVSERYLVLLQNHDAELATISGTNSRVMAESIALAAFENLAYLVGMAERSVRDGDPPRSGYRVAEPIIGVYDTQSTAEPQIMWLGFSLETTEARAKTPVPATRPPKLCEHIGCINGVESPDPAIVYCGMRSCASITGRRLV